MRDDFDFRRRADDALRSLLRALAPVAEDYGFRTGIEDGILQIGFPPPQGSISIAPHAPSQVWITNGGKTRKLTWDVVENAFILEATGQDLQQVLEESISQRIGEDVTL